MNDILIGIERCVFGSWGDEAACYEDEFEFERSWNLQHRYPGRNLDADAIGGPKRQIINADSDCTNG
jgi:hypothetical protein